MTGQTSRKGRPVVLIGFMATGKTTVGRLVAERLDRRFLDLDQLVEETAGTTVADLFRTAGEPAFRRAEAQALRKALATREIGRASCRERVWGVGGEGGGEGRGRIG